MATKIYQDYSVLEASRSRISNTFDEFEKIYVSFSGGKDSTVMLHLVMEEAIKRNRRVGVLIIDLEAQYKDTIIHLEKTVELYKDYIELHWFCGELLLRNALTNFEPRWICWDEDKKELWVREKPSLASDLSQYDFYVPKMEFEELMVIFGNWYSQNGKYKTAAMVGIRSNESLHRYRAIVSDKKDLMIKDWHWTTKVGRTLYNIYPIYDWRTEDIWVYHGKYPNKTHNRIYDQMMKAGVKLSDQRLCQPFGDDQKRGLWLYHILEPDTWYKLINRSVGINSGALYVQENGNMTGVNKISKPENHTWESYCNMLLATLPEKMSLHYKARFRKFISGWKDRGYKTVPDEAPHELEVKCWAPSWRRMVRVILRNDYWCKSLGQTQPKSEAYLKFKQIRDVRRRNKALETTLI